MPCTTICKTISIKNAALQGHALSFSTDSHHILPAARSKIHILYIRHCMIQNHINIKDEAYATFNMTVYQFAGTYVSFINNQKHFKPHLHIY